MGRWADRQIGRWAGRQMSKWASGVALTICLSAYLPICPPAPLAQQKPPTPTSRSQQQAFVLRTQTNEVLVDVRVYDKSGKPVTDLKESDFRVVMKWLLCRIVGSN